MDDKLRGRKVKVVVDEIVKDTIRVSNDIGVIDGEGFYDYGFERVLDYIMDHGRTTVMYRQIENYSKKLWKQFIKNEKKGATYFIDELSRRFSEDNDHAFEYIRERLIEKLEEADFDDVSRRDWEEWAAVSAKRVFLVLGLLWRLRYRTPNFERREVIDSF